MKQAINIYGLEGNPEDDPYIPHPNMEICSHHGEPTSKINRIMGAFGHMEDTLMQGHLHEYSKVWDPGYFPHPTKIVYSDFVILMTNFMRINEDSKLFMRNMNHDNIDLALRDPGVRGEDIFTNTNDDFQIE
ncbi:hypothetical protein KI387_001551, partial [Taxus chinensis]